MNIEVIEPRSLPQTAAAKAGFQPQALPEQPSKTPDYSSCIPPFHDFSRLPQSLLENGFTRCHRRSQWRLNASTRHATLTLLRNAKPHRNTPNVATKQHPSNHKRLIAGPKPIESTITNRTGRTISASATADLVTRFRVEQAPTRRAVAASSAHAHGRPILPRKSASAIDGLCLPIHSRCAV